MNRSVFRTVITWLMVLTAAAVPVFAGEAVPGDDTLSFYLGKSSLVIDAEITGNLGFTARDGSGVEYPVFVHCQEALAGKAPSADFLVSIGRFNPTMDLPPNFLQKGMRYILFLRPDHNRGGLSPICELAASLVTAYPNNPAAR